MRTATIERNTAETQIKLWINLDGTGQYEICTGCGFLDHMLNLFARHGRFDLRAECRGDTQVDYHHTVEDMGIALGRAFAAALGDMRGITRYGSMILPMETRPRVGMSLPLITIEDLSPLIRRLSLSLIISAPAISPL